MGLTNKNLRGFDDALWGRAAACTTASDCFGDLTSAGLADSSERVSATSGGGDLTEEMLAFDALDDLSALGGFVEVLFGDLTDVCSCEVVVVSTREGDLLNAAVGVCAPGGDNSPFELTRLGAAWIKHVRTIINKEPKSQTFQVFG